MRLPTQTFVSRTSPDPARMKPVRNAKQIHWKPEGGLWTSTLDEEGGAWVGWVTSEYDLSDERFGGEVWLLEPTNANIAVIDNPDDLRSFAGAHPHPLQSSLKDDIVIETFSHLLDWESLAASYDAVHFPNPYPWRLTMDMATSMFFNVLDVESTVWFRWCFTGEPRQYDLPVSEGRT